MEDGQIEDFTSKIYKMKDFEKTAEKNKTQRANKADKTKNAEKELQRVQKENKKLTAQLAQSRMPFLEDKRGSEDEIDAEQVQLYTANTTPRKQRFGQASVKDRLGQTRSQKKLKANNVDRNTSSNFSGNKRFREERDQPGRDQPIADGDDGDWHYAEEEEENYHFIDAKVAELRHGSMDEDEDQDVYAHSA